MLGYPVIWRKKPPVGIGVNAAHPLAAPALGLRYCFLFNETGGNRAYNLAPAPAAYPATNLRGNGALGSTATYTANGLNLDGSATGIVNLGDDDSFTNNAIFAFRATFAAVSGVRTVLGDHNSNGADNTFTVYCNASLVEVWYAPNGSNENKAAHSSVALVPGVPYSICVMRYGSTPAVQIFVNGVDVTVTDNVLPVPSRASTDPMCIGRAGSYTGGSFFSGTLDYFYAWIPVGAPPASMAMALHQNPYAFLTGQTVQEDMFASALASLLTSTFFAASSPSSAGIGRSVAKAIAASSSTASATTNRSLSRAIAASLSTMSASVTRALQRSLAAASGTAVAVLTRTSQRLIALSASTASMSGNAARLVQRLVLATKAANSGSVLRAIARSVLATTEAASGSAVRSIARLIAAATATAHGTTTKQVSRALFASLPAFSGSAMRSSVLTFAAVSNAFSGFLTTGRAAFASFTAVLPAMAGSLARQATRALRASAATVSTDVSRSIDRVIPAATVAFAANTTRAITRILDASLSAFAGTVTGSRSRLVEILASLSFSASAPSRSIFKVTTATLAPFSAILPRSISRTFSAFLGFLGSLIPTTRGPQPGNIKVVVLRYSARSSEPSISATCSVVSIASAKARATESHANIDVTVTTLAA